MNALLIAYISLSSAFLPLSMGIIQWKRLSPDLKLTVLIPLTALIADFSALALSINKINTWPILNLFLVVQFSLLFVVIGYQQKIHLLRILFFGSLAFAVINFLFLQKPEVFNSYTAYVAGILIILTALNYLYRLLSERQVEKVQSLPQFWIAFAALTYHASTLFLFLFNNYLIAHQLEHHQSIWILHNLLNVIKNGFLFFALWVSYKVRTSPL